jgi:phosphoribosyl 1,2-cyclic phosphodiesterase
MRSTLTALTLLSLAGAAGAAEPYHLIPGAVPLDSGPDGNTIVLDAPKGLIVFDTGRHPEHAQKILDYAKARHRPIAAIVNSHWHLDHTTGNWDIRQAYANNAAVSALAIEVRDFATICQCCLGRFREATPTKTFVLRCPGRGSSTCRT